MSSKGLTIALSAVLGVIALVVGVMAVGAMPLGADRPHISDAAYARRTAAADKLQGRIEALANDVPPALPEVPARLTADGSGSVPSDAPATPADVPQAATPDVAPIPDQAQQPPATADDGGYRDDGDRDGEHGERD